MTLSERVREKLAFNNKGFALALSSSVQSQHDFVDGVKHESKRLAPLHEALAQAVVKLEQIKKRFDDEDKGGLPPPERAPGMAWAMMTDSTEALKAIEAALGGEK